MLQPPLEVDVHLSPMQSAMLATSLASLLVQVLTLRVFIKRGLRSHFPIFFRYTAYSVGVGLLTSAAYLAACQCFQYAYLYYAVMIPWMCLQFGVMYESFVNALKPYSALIDLGKMIFRWAGVFLLLAALVTGLATHGPQSNRIINAAQTVNQILALMQTGLLLLFFAFERKLGLAWRSYSMAIALGLGICAATDLSTTYIGNQFPAIQNAFGLAGNIIFLAVVAFWALCFYQAEPARKNVMESPARLIFQRWNEALLSHGYGQAVAASSVESFLPGIEKTVDRVMARTIH